MADDELDLVTQTAVELFRTARDHTGDDTAAESAAGWKLLVDHDMSRVSVPQPSGAGESLQFLGALLKATGRSGFSLPLIDTHVGATLIGAAEASGWSPGADIGGAYAVGLDPRLLCPSAPRSPRLEVVHPGLADTVVTAVPHAEAVRVDVWRWNDLDVEVGHNIAGEPIAIIDVQDLPRSSWSGVIPAHVARAAALTDLLGRSLMIVGAAERALEQTLDYVGEREQFGRALAGFQSVQHTVAQMASLVAAASISADAALAALDSQIHVATGTDFEEDLVVAVLACRIQCSRTAAFVARAAHQLHGAIGFTDEHSLRLASTRLTAWRSHGPTQADVAMELGRRAFAAAELWPFITGTNRLQSESS